MVLREFLRAKIHRATVTAADLDYEGSVTIDGDLLRAAGIDHLERVDIWDVSNGARLSTYVIRGASGSGVVQINGAAAHRVHPGDVVIIAAYALVGGDELADHRARVVHVDGDNRMTEVQELAPAVGEDNGRTHAAT
jgi:aspartate 1-decarboxylase